ncbi:MAG TPA: substrate-binding domain-containing protein, partial [Anaerolineales bacterium]|nr:substrate-binding domain-containing protein [Anaerolineales bacterium]
MRKQTLTLLSVLTVLSMLLVACGATATEAPATEAAPTEEPLSGTLSISGAFALYPMMTVWAEEFTKLHPDVQFDVQGGGAGKGMTDTIAGAVDIGMI